MTEYKTADLRKLPEPARPAHYNGRGGAPLERHWWSTYQKAQDSTPASARRLIACQTMGEQELLVPSGTDPEAGSGTQDYPDLTTDRVIMRARCHQSAGTVLEARTLMLPVGPSQEFVDASYELDEYDGTLKISGGWSSEDGTNTASATAEQTTAAGGETYAGLPTGNGAYWNVVRPVYSEIIAPANRQQPATAADYSEGTRCTLTIEHQGGVRCVSCSVSERPYIHATGHAVLESTAHDYPETLTHPHRQPRVEGEDGTFQERRFGTDRTAAVSERQRERMGPIIASWSAYTESQGVAVTEPAGISTSSTSFVSLTDSSVTAWGVNEAGFAVPGHYALPRDRRIVSQRAGLIPVRIWLYAGMDTGGDTGVVRFQTSSRSWIDISIGNPATWYTATGYLECQRTSDDGGGANLMVFHRRASGTGSTEVKHFTVEFGAFDYG